MSENKAVAVTLYLPQFTTPPGPDGELETVACTEFTHVRARDVASQIIDVMGKMPITPLSADLITLAYAYISRDNLAAAK